MWLNRLRNILIHFDDHQSDTRQKTLEWLKWPSMPNKRNTPLDRSHSVMIRSKMPLTGPQTVPVSILHNEWSLSNEIKWNRNDDIEKKIQRKRIREDERSSMNDYNANLNRILCYAPLFETHYPPMLNCVCTWWENALLIEVQCS